MASDRDTRPAVRIARLWEGANPRVTRRSMLRSMAFFAVAAQGLAACGVGEAPSGGDTGPAGATPASNDVDEPVLNFYNWTDYIDEETLPGFEAETGIRVTYDNFSSNDELEAKIASGAAGYDLVIPTDNFLRRFLRSDLLRPLDHDMLPNLGNLQQRFREADYDRDNRFSVPWAWGTTGLAYSPEQLGEDVTSLAGFDLPSARGRSILLDEARDGLALGLLALGHDPNTVEQSELDEAVAYLLELKGRLGQITSDVIEPLASGQAPLAQAYSGDVFQAQEINSDLVYVIPEEGGLSWVDVLCIPNDAPHAANAHRFIDYILRPEVGARLAEEIQYASPNEAALELIDPALREDPLIYPPADELARLPFTADLGAETEGRYADAWTRVKTG
ncbi:ABC transporter substrate-binding protein [Actinoalloteichus hymeniacidonis]|uniref:Spermidine/putrescine-binding periplasmic protein n=1 Tax=Actinoalloteichus hymeniacidonis TaxID=340345 RepID=A0AAC9HNH8_9PSEU|nr:spermidine/putrescine ABC transporter substrate-binding protein [Actinoalloteichus hymeniacidonis]AOS62599.1 spermidine/putrescine-binding periplasmic protein [Actinoalloteichus hymeniacidonis]MBB5909369.1 spermidine/putrescine transport system substrate-binding protein [Actinoalloteichus hymeniacidonis]